MNQGIMIALLHTIGQTTFQSLSSVNKTTEKQSQNPDILGSLESHIWSPYTKCLLNLTVLMQISKWLCFASTDLSPVHTGQ